MRLDESLVVRKIVDSRNKAKSMILDEKVLVNGKVIKKPSYKIKESDVIKLIDSKVYVSRAAWKLKNYLQKYSINFKNSNVLDVGSSTGGFSEVALEYGAQKVVCVDVGRDQLHEILRKNKKIELFENTDIRKFEYPEKFDVVVSDVSFISLLKIIKKIDSFALKDIILLFKPQFEVGKDVKRDKRGVVKDKEAVNRARENFEKECLRLNWRLVRCEPSSIKGKEGNEEYVYHYLKV